jgi:hypothetical protein
LCEAWCFIFKGKCRLGVFENRVLKRIFKPKRDDKTEVGEKSIMRSFINFTPAKYYWNDHGGFHEQGI